MSTPYLPPLDRLLALGKPEVDYRVPWPDYRSTGLSAEHVPELIRMATDAELVEGDDDAAETYGGIHAWRTLGQLRAEAAIDPLLDFLGETDDEWALGEIPEVLGMMGPAAFEPLRAALARWSLQRDSWVAGAAARGLMEITKRFPDTRDAAVEALARQLRWWARQDPDLNTTLVHDLVEMHAVEAAPVIEEAFAADAVDTRWFADDWEDVQVALGLLPERITPRLPYVPPVRPSPMPFLRVQVAKPAAGPKRRKKAGKATRRHKSKRR
jgi:HEAT repeat protein